jgi:hypothetical protein
MTRLRRLSINQHKRGIALMLILGSLLLATAAFVGFYRFSQSFLQKTATYTSQVQTEFDSQHLAERTRRAILSKVQNSVDGSAQVNLMSLINPDALQGDVFLESQERILEVRCIGQGSGDGFQHQVCNGATVLPKVFEFSVQSTNPATQQMKVVRQEIHINGPSLNNYAFLIRWEDREGLNQTGQQYQPFTLMPSTYNGLFGIIFKDPEFVPPNQNPRVRLAPSATFGNLIFQKPLVTNLPNPQTQIQIPADNAPYLQMPEGVVAASQRGIDFGNLNDVYSDLRSTSVNSAALAALPPGTVINCSTVTLLRASSGVRIRNFTDNSCSNPVGAATDYSVQSNEAIYAPGQNVFLQTEVTSGGVSSENGKTKVGNIAIVADGDVQLLSSIRRDETMADNQGYPSVMTPGRLIISQNMTTMLSGSPTLGAIPTGQNAAYGQQSIQVDLSYLAVGSPGPSYNGNANLVVDPQLFGASNSQATNLGIAKFNGMFMSDRAPQTRVLYGGNVDGFSKVEWTHPPALSSINTPWFSTQLGGGALQASVVRSEQTTLDLSQALSAFNGPLVDSLAEPSLGN